MAPAVLAYWDIRGLAQPIRFILEYTGTEYEDKLYKCGPAPDYDKSCWFDVKFKLGLDFPNLPYYIEDGGPKITQSNAIMRHIARANDLCGKTEDEKIRVDMVENQAEDFKMAFIKLCYNPDFEKLKAQYQKDLKSSLKQFSEFLGDNKWFAGESITFPDFIMYEALDQHRVLDPDCLNSFQNLLDFHKHFEKLPKIKAYMESSRFIKSPLNNKMAKFGNV